VKKRGDGRPHELSAWELKKRKAKLRKRKGKKGDARDQMAPVSGQEKQKKGEPLNR